MSHPAISRSPDLRKLEEDGYVLEIRGGFLVVHDVPYVNSKRDVRRGVLVCALELAGDVAIKPRDHVAKWIGEHPCHHDGAKLSKIEHPATREEALPGFFVDHTFSAKPKRGASESYDDFHDKVRSYDAIISGPAEHLDPHATARTRRVVESPDDSPFHYIDTASSRANIAAISGKLAVAKVAIVGVGGTGSYVLDLVAKTPVREIHLFDHDEFLQHNAFRSPGAPSVDELRSIPSKVAHFAGVYSKMHRGIVSHPGMLDGSNVSALKTMDHVFVCIDHGPAKRLIVDKLQEWNVPFVDVGMGLYRAADRIGGVVRTTTITATKCDHVDRTISFGEGDPNADYSAAIQVADLNALNAALAVIRWKKLCGFYLDLECEHDSTYTIDGNTIANEEFA